MAHRPSLLALGVYFILYCERRRTSKRQEHTSNAGDVGEQSHIYHHLLHIYRYSAIRCSVDFLSPSSSLKFIAAAPARRSFVARMPVYRKRPKYAPKADQLSRRWSTRPTLTYPLSYPLFSMRSTLRILGIDRTTSHRRNENLSNPQIVCVGTVRLCIVCRPAGHQYRRIRAANPP